MAKGFTQHSEMEFGMFGPVAGFDALRIVVPVSASKRRNVNALDSKQAYLDTPLAEEIWFDLPSRKVVQACNVVHGVHRSAMEWWEKWWKIIVGGGWESTARDE